MDDLSLASVRGEILDGDLLFFEGTGVFDWLIRWWTGSHFSHVAVCVWDTIAGEKTLCAFEAEPGIGVRMNPLDRYLDYREKEGTRVIWYSLQGPPAKHRDMMVKYCRNVWGENYSHWWQFVWSFGPLAKLRRKLGLNPEINPERPFCSWVASAALRHAGYRPAGDVPPSMTSPADVAKYDCLKLRGVLKPFPRLAEAA